MTDPTPMVSTPKKMTTICPCCRLPVRFPGRLASANDYAGTAFIFGVCVRCTGRLDRLPIPVQQRQLNRAALRVAGQPERYLVHICRDAIEARLLVALSSEAGLVETLKLFE